MPDLKPLYLDGVQPLRVALDGCALKVRGPERAPCRYPLRRLSRIIVSGEVEWATRALTACLRAGVVVTFLDGDGELAGLCLGVSPQGRGLDECLAEFADRVDWPIYYESWYMAMQRRGTLALVRSLSLRVPDLRTGTIRQAYAARLARLVEPEVARRVVGYLESATFAFAASQLASYGIAATRLTDEGKGFQLYRDMGRLLVWEARLLAVRILTQRRQSPTPNRRELAAAIEHRSGQLAGLVHEYLGYLEHVISGLNYGDAGQGQ